ncbi:MAG: hypothetical protein M3Q56_02435 [Bacteroidota bacterium]|nr:hypothetical protein [Bacteroidota bacterium]
MTCFRTYYRGIIVLLALSTAISCRKEEPAIISSNLDVLNHKLATEWYEAGISTIGQINGYAEPIAARALSYIAYTMYETTIPVLPDYNSLQARVDGFQITLPQVESGKEYHQAIIANQALYELCLKMFASAGQANMLKLLQLKDGFLKEFSSGQSQEVILNSIELGSEIGKAIFQYSLTDQQNDAFLRNYPDYQMPVGEGFWIPTPPDYTEKVLLPTWGKVRPFSKSNVDNNFVSKRLDYSARQSSVIYSEAYEVYSSSINLTDIQKGQIEYWNRSMDPHASPVLHNMLLTIQLIKEKELRFPLAMETLVKMSLAIHDSYIAAWKLKFEKNLLRPSSYIKQHISRFYVPEVHCIATPDFVSETAVIYSAASQILSQTFGFRTPFMDFTQFHRIDLREKNKRFESFEAMAKEAAYTDILAGVHFRTSIDAGYEIGYDIANNILRYPFKK